MSHDHAGHDMGHAMPSMNHDNMNPDHPMHMGMGMSMFYHFGSMETILFKFWSTDSAIGIIISFIVVVLFCYLLEAIKWIRVSWRNKVADSTLPIDSTADRNTPNRTVTCPMIGDFVLHAVQLFLSYSLMMIFMTFNVWLCAAVVFGEASAHLFFRVMLPGLDRTVGPHIVAIGSCG